jgi:quercetin dioxygenase-like cupin family protein
MADPFLVNIAERPDLQKVKPGPDGTRQIPGVRNAPVLRDAKGTTRFLGREGPEIDKGPFVYYSERPKGDVIPMHRHGANRVEFLIEGKIEWREQGKAPKVYEAGTLSHVEAGVSYGYAVLEDAKILIMFDKAPGINMI